MCQYCKQPHPLKRSTRKHGRPPREFWLCPCGRTVQGIPKGKTVSEIIVRAANPTVVRAVRLTLQEEDERKKAGETVRGYIERKAKETVKPRR